MITTGITIVILGVAWLVWGIREVEFHGSYNAPAFLFFGLFFGPIMILCGGGLLVYALVTMDADFYEHWKRGWTEFWMYY